MKTYIALLRGINVSGKNLIKMAELKVLFTKIGLNNVITYIQSGNVIFTSETNKTLEIETRIIKAIKTKFGYDLKVLVITKKELEITYNSNPYTEISTIDITKLCVIFLRNTPTLENVSQIKKLVANSKDEFEIAKKSVYLHCPTGFAKTKLTNNLFERKLKTDATTRNWRTITKLLELSKP